MAFLGIGAAHVQLEIARWMARWHFRNTRLGAERGGEEGLQAAQGGRSGTDLDASKCRRRGFWEQGSQQGATSRAAPDTPRRGTQVGSAVYFRLALLLQRAETLTPSCLQED